MGGRSGSFRHSRGHTGGGSDKKDLGGGGSISSLQNLKAGAVMNIDQADNNSANPEYLGGVEGRAEFEKYDKVRTTLLKMNNKEIPYTSEEYWKMYNLCKKKYTKLNRIIKNNEPYSINCQRCTVAYELRRRGFDVTAKPNFSKRQSKGHIESDHAFGNKWVDIANPQDNHLDKHNKLVDTNLKKVMKVGQRGRIKWMWRESESGHTINVERTKKGILYVDAQSGRKETSFVKYMGSNNYASSSALGGVTYERTDNAKINSSVNFSDLVEARKR